MRLYITCERHGQHVIKFSYSGDLYKVRWFEANAIETKEKQEDPHTHVVDVGLAILDPWVNIRERDFNVNPGNSCSVPREIYMHGNDGNDKKA